jgi:hypothetical protein
MHGVNDAMRDQVLHMKLTEAGVPMRALGSVPTAIGPLGVSLVSDQGRHYAQAGGIPGADLSRPGDDWLVEKGTGKKADDVADEDRAEARAKAAARILDVEIGARPLAQQGIEKVEG